MTRRRRLVLALVLSAVYVGSYVWYRARHLEVREETGRHYVMYPAESGAVLMLYRPMAHLDQGLTGTGTHLGPHHE
jgi:hypothetical protein